MSAYLTVDDMLQLFEEEDLIKITNLNYPSAGVINMMRLQAAVNGACGIVNGYLARKFILPFQESAVPAEVLQALTIHAANIARNILDGSLEEVRKRHEDAIAWLKLFTDAKSGTGNENDTTPGVDPLEGIGSINYEIAPIALGKVAELF